MTVPCIICRKPIVPEITEEVCCLYMDYKAADHWHCRSHHDVEEEDQAIRNYVALMITVIGVTK